MLKRIPMIKMELVQQSCNHLFYSHPVYFSLILSIILLPIPTDAAGNETMTAHQIVMFLDKANFDIYADHWNEQDLYFGRHNQKVLDIDKLFGSQKHNLPANPDALHEAARIILRSPIDASKFNQKEFLKSHTDIIAIERTLSHKMRRHWLGDDAPK